MKHYVLLLFLFTGLTACKKNVLIPKKDFISILTELYVSKAYFSSEGIHNARWQDTIPYNYHVVQQRGYNWAQFDSTVSWYCSHPKKYKDVYEAVMSNLTELDKIVSEELDPPSELWQGRKNFKIPIGLSLQDSVSANITLKGEGSYVLSAKIRVFQHDASIDPRIELYLWKADTTKNGIKDTLWIAPLKKDGLMYEYRMEKTLTPDNEYTHLKGNWLECNRNNPDSAWTKNIEIKDISVYHIPKKFKEKKSKKTEK